jgi:hypothetical protein
VRCQLLCRLYTHERQHALLLLLREWIINNRVSHATNGSIMFNNVLSCVGRAATRGSPARGSLRRGEGAHEASSSSHTPSLYSTYAGETTIAAQPHLWRSAR